MSTKAGERRQLDSIKVTKSWIARMKKARSTHHPGKEQHRDLDEILEEADEPHQARD